MTFKWKLYLLCLFFLMLLGLIMDAINILLGSPLYKFDLTGYLLVYISVIVTFTISFLVAWHIAEKKPTYY